MDLSWSERRRYGIYAGFGIAALLLITGIVFAVVYDVPTCTDGKQNADETGVDCGGSCAYMCNASVETPRTTFARTVTSGGRTDVIAYIENRNRDAEAKDARYTIELFDDTGALLGKRDGSIDLPARSTVAIYVPGILQGIGVAPRAFVTFDTDMKWRAPKEADVLVTVSNTQLTLSDKPRVTATLKNPSPDTLYDRTVVATVFGSDGLAIAASKTVARTIPGLDTADVVFTWSEPFVGEAARVEVNVLPVLP